MHFHHKHDIDGCTTDHAGDWPDWAVAILATIDRRDLQLMTAVQADLDAATTVITELVAKVGDLEAKLAAPAPALDSAALNTEVAAAQAVLNPAPAAPAAPVEGSAAEESAESPAQAAAEPDAQPAPAVEPAPAPVEVPAASPPPSVPLA